MKRIIVKSKVSSDGVLHLDVPIGLTDANTEVQVTVETAPPAATGGGRPLSASDLLHSDLVGMWADREDIDNQNVLYLATEFGVWASIDRGGSWTKINNNLPTVAVHELAQHPASGELVVATHGRSLWILDATPLRQMKPHMLKAEATLDKPATAMRWRREPRRGTPFGGGEHRFIGENPPYGAQIYYSLCKPAEKVQLKIVDYTGRTVRVLPVKKEQRTAGLHCLTWDLVRGPGAGPGRRRFPSLAPAGMYRVVLTVDGKEHTQGLRVENDPLLKTPSIIAEDEDEDDEEEREKHDRWIDD